MKESAYNETLQTLQRQFNEYREAFARVRTNMMIRSIEVIVVWKF